MNLAVLAALALLTLPARAQEHGEHMEMSGMYGPYSMDREASGTSWQPDSTPHQGLHAMSDDWMIMAHGYASLQYDKQGGTRSGDRLFGTSALMLMAWRPAGPGTLGLRGMMSLDPATIGRNGYPLLFQTGETGDGMTPLIDRQHPHDAIMELAAAYSLPLGEQSSVFGYLGYPGEPALGPPAFMHRFSGDEIPQAPLTHHWLDSTHVAFGVATAGVVWSDLKLEGSSFTGREPDQYRWDVERPRFDSYSGRLSWNPTRDWALQASAGHIRSPESLDPDVDQDRLTASASYNRTWGASAWQTTVAWGRQINAPGHDLDAFLLESTVSLDRTHTFFARAEHVAKDELFLPGAPLSGRVFEVNALTAGYIRDFARWRHGQWGLGGLLTADLLPASLEPAYGSTPLSFMLFLRVKLA